MKPNGDIDYRAHFSRAGLTRSSLDAACAMALERLRRQLWQRVRREVERMRRNQTATLS